MSDTVVVAGSVTLNQLIDPAQVTMYSDDVVVIAPDGTDITPDPTDVGVEATAQPPKTVVIQSPEHKLLLRTVPRVTMYGPDVNLV
jgi:hypothetical protein